MPALKILYGVHEGAIVDRWICRKIRVRWKVAHQLKQSREPRDAGIGAAGSNRLVYRRELLAIIVVCEFNISLQGLNRTPVAGIPRLHLSQNAGNVARTDNVVFEKFG